MIRPDSQFKLVRPAIKVTEFLSGLSVRHIKGSDMKEEWKKIEGHPTYEVSNFGRVMSLWFVNGTTRRLRDKPKILSLKNGGGYPSIALNIPNKVRVHVLVLEAFVGPRPEGFHACHNDGNKENNHISNLRWDTVKNNFADKKKHGTWQIGEKGPNAKLKNKDVLNIRKRVKNGSSLTEMAEMYDLARATIYSIAHRKTWKHI